MLALLAFIAGLLIYLIVSVSRISKMGIQIKRMLLQLVSARVLDMTGGELPRSAAADDVEVAHDQAARRSVLATEVEDEEEEDSEVCSITAEASAAAGADDREGVESDELSEISLEDGEERIKEEREEPEEVPEGPPPSP